MFNVEDIQAKLKQRPFQSVRLLISSGDHYDIYHPDLVVVGKRHLFVGTPSEDNPTVFDRSNLLWLMHITAIENLPAVTPTESNDPHPGE